MFRYRPERIIIDKAVSSEPLTEQICARFPEVSKVIVDNFAWHQDESNVDPLRNPLTHGKKTLHLKYFRGASFKVCPGFSDKVICCNYFTLDLIENCPFECTYCKDPFCDEHRLPEDHRCVKLTVLRAKKFGEKKVIRDGGPGSSKFKRFFGRFR